MENDEERLGLQFIELDDVKDFLEEEKRQKRDRQVEVDMRMADSWFL
jgi:hypothetical protein